MRSLLAEPEKRFIAWLTPKFPRWIEGYHLTLLTILWSVGIGVCGRLARLDFDWLWLSSFFIFLQWFTDSFDGSLGRHRDTGIPKWGFYMDHLLDIVFLFSIFIGYSFLLSGKNVWMLYLFMLICSGFMINSLLAFASTGEFKITFLGFGPTEMRILFILINTGIIFWGTRFIEWALPFAIGIGLSLMVFIVARTQAYIWKKDMEQKGK